MPTLLAFAYYYFIHFFIFFEAMVTRNSKILDVLEKSHVYVHTYILLHSEPSYVISIREEEFE